ncbi:hypothetical protein MLD63_11515 [Paracoccus sp. TK19116]|uniref:Chemotaxis protein n=1 Tax=Paracoccus albicereus TaxID=2922394 RepID=A0ABT1MRX3_9RHOB|nr:hypothetical protein [Paracoccus albicereus]MCQ0971050.1 hypothetical protein [Paracoccus albicereus]
MTFETILQGVILAGALGLAAFCTVLARRLRRLNDLETGLGGAIAVMASEVDRLEKAIIAARDEAKTASEALAIEIARSRSERANWELHRKIAEAAPIMQIAPRPATPSRRLRKREGQSHA